MTPFSGRKGYVVRKTSSQSSTKTGMCFLSHPHPIFWRSTELLCTWIKEEEREEGEVEEEVGGGGGGRKRNTMGSKCLKNLSITISLWENYPKKEKKRGGDLWSLSRLIHQHRNLCRKSIGTHTKLLQSSYLLNKSELSSGLTHCIL